MKNLKNHFLSPITLFIIIISFGSSCLVVKKYEAPISKTALLYKLSDSEQNALANVSWRNLFTDKILQTYIDTALYNNFDFKVALKNLDNYLLQFKQSKLGYLPSVNIGLRETSSLTPNTSPQAVFQKQINQLDLSLPLTWEADIWGKITSTKKATYAGFLQTGFAVQALQTQIIANIANTYFRLLALDDKLKVAKKTLENRKVSLETIKNLKIAGNQNEVAVKQNEAQYYYTQTMIQDIEYEIIVQENALNMLLGRGAGYQIERGVFATQKINSEIKTGVPALLLTKRPDVKQAEAAFMNAFELKNVAHASLYPSLVISPLIGLQNTYRTGSNISSPGGLNIFLPEAFYYSIISNLAGPLFNRGILKTNLATANNNQQIALLKFHQTLINAGKEVSDALATYNNETAKLEFNQKQLVALNEAVSSSYELLKYGSADYLSVLTATDSELNTAFNLVENKYKQLKSVVDLYRALGGGVE